MACKDAKACPWDGAGGHIVVLELQLLLCIGIQGFGFRGQTWCLPAAKELLQSGGAWLSVAGAVGCDTASEEVPSGRCCQEQQYQAGAGRREWCWSGLRLWVRHTDSGVCGRELLRGGHVTVRAVRHLVFADLIRVLACQEKPLDLPLVKTLK